MNNLRKATITIEYDRDDKYTQLRCGVAGLLDVPGDSEEEVFYMIPQYNDTLIVTIARVGQPDIEIGILPTLV